MRSDAHILQFRELRGVGVGFLVSLMVIQSMSYWHQ